MSVKYLFSHEDDACDHRVASGLTLPDDTHYKDIAEHFFRFLSSVYGYEITAKDVIDADFSDS